MGIVSKTEDGAIEGAGLLALVAVVVVCWLLYAKFKDLKMPGMPDFSHLFDGFLTSLSDGASALSIWLFKFRDSLSLTTPVSQILDTGGATAHTGITSEEHEAEYPSDEGTNPVPAEGQ
jgi:hypothetical protein